MFLTRMVNGFLNSNKNNSCFNQNDDELLPQATITIPNSEAHNPLRTITNKSKKKSDKSKRIDSKRSITKFFKSSPKEPSRECQQPSTSKRAVSNNEGNSKSLLSTKVKSGSWKRSDKKTNTVLNVLTSKKSKAFRKKSPNLLSFSNATNSVYDERPIITTSAENNSACRPGTLYSDVLFGAAPSSFIKVKILTPRRNVGETAQKKLTKALLKCSSNEKTELTTDESELEGDQHIFPSLYQLPHSRIAVDVASSVTTSSSSSTPCSDSQKTITSVDVSSNYGSVSSPTKSEEAFEEADVIILSEHNAVSHIDTTPITYGNYLEQQFQELDLNTGPNASSNAQQSHDYSQSKSQFHIDIPSWNFTEPDISPHGYPKFLQQFDDEYYLKREKLAMLGLNLALGNSPHQGKFKF